MTASTPTDDDPTSDRTPEPTASLTGAFAKVGRAYRHLGELAHRLARHLADPELFQGPLVIHHDRVDTSQLRPKVVPLDAQVVAGDVVQNLRSALDHAAWQIVIASKAVPKEGKRGTEFPIGFGPACSIRTVRGEVEDRFMAVVRSAQPTERGEDHPLLFLRHLSNVDKHRTLIRGRRDLDFMGPFGPLDRLTDPVTGWLSTESVTLDDLDEVLVRITLDRPDIVYPPTTAYRLAIEVGTTPDGKPIRRSPIRTLQWIADNVHRVIDRLDDVMDFPVDAIRREIRDRRRPRR